ncbi:MAG: hypothetical protein ABI286_12155 [Edaphobacter sp.]
MPEVNSIPPEQPLSAPDANSAPSKESKEPSPMIDIHPPEHTPHSWRDFFIHIITIVIGLLIAIGLEQTVEAIHHRHQRHQLQEDLHNEAEQNQQIIARDLRMQDLEPWFDQAMLKATPADQQRGRLRITLPAPPCIPGSVGTAAIRYFAPSQAVWTTAKEAGLVPLLPVEVSRMQARLAHNYDLLGDARDHVANGCQAIVAMQQRFAQPSPDNAATEIWTMTPDQAEHLATTASDTRVAIQGLLFRLRWSRIYEEGLANGETAADVKMMTINQERFEDPKNPPTR